MYCYTGKIFWLICGVFWLFNNKWGVMNIKRWGLCFYKHWTHMTYLTCNYIPTTYKREWLIFFVNFMGFITFFCCLSLTFILWILLHIHDKSWCFSAILIFQVVLKWIYWNVSNGFEWKLYEHEPKGLQKEYLTKNEMKRKTELCTI